MLSYDFPGNVRELENILERAAAFANDGCIDVIDLGLRSSFRAATPTEVQAAPASALPFSDQSPVAETVQDDTKIQHLSVFTKPDLPCVLPEYLETIEREVIRAALLKTRNNRTQAAELLGVSFRQLRYSIQKLKIHDTEAD